MKQILTINAHGIINFTKCPRRYLLSEIYETEKSAAMERGVLYATFLEIYYKRRRKGISTIVSPFWTQLIEKRLNCSREEAEIVWRAMSRYIKTYANESWIPIAIEEGFSRILHESDDYIFVVEGRPDLVVKENDELIVVDHKTQSSFRPLPNFNHQSMMYLYATGTTKFCYNYIIMKKEPEFRRELLTVSAADIEYWKQLVIELMFEITRSKFLPNFNCVDQYGLCKFFKVCTQPSVKYQEWILSTQFKKRKERKKSWS